MNPGRLDSRILLKTPSSSSLDRFGQSIMTYATASVWAEVQKQSGNEVNAKGLLISSATYIFTIRSRPNVDEKAVIEYGGKTYNVVFVEDFANDMYQKLTGERV